jgi:predicted enzyme related to lactoylglutathione lyase
MPRVVHFEINSDDPEKAVKFYESVFGWKIDKWEGPIDYWLITTGDKSEQGIDGGLMKRENPQATISTTIEVESIDEYLKNIEANGGKVTVPKHAIPGVGYAAYFIDPDGNTLGLMQNDENAK